MASNNLLWEFETGGEVWSSPVVGACGSIYVGSNDNEVYAIKPDSKGPANRPDDTILRQAIRKDHEFPHAECQTKKMESSEKIAILSALREEVIGTYVKHEYEKDDDLSWYERLFGWRHSSRMPDLLSHFFMAFFPDTSWRIMTYRRTLLEDGVVKRSFDGKKQKDAKWEISEDGELHIKHVEGAVEVFSIDKGWQNEARVVRGIVELYWIDGDGKRWREGALRHTKRRDKTWRKTTSV